MANEKIRIESNKKPNAIVLSQIAMAHALVWGEQQQQFTLCAI